MRILNISVNAHIISEWLAMRKSFDLVRLFAALADRTGLRLLNLMQDREVCVCYFVEILEQGQPKISRHLAYRRKAGVVNARREGKWMHYRIDRPSDAKHTTLWMPHLSRSRLTGRCSQIWPSWVKPAASPSGSSLCKGAPVPTRLDAQPA